jgi:mono/diheme cytochrome c family protein
MSIGKVIGAGLALSLGLMLAIGGWAQEQKGEHAHPPGTPPHEHPKATVRITMDELHKHGGVPPGWRFTFPDGNPKAGREVFVKLECCKCHEVKGEHFPNVPKQAEETGPELTGMGTHHPAEYLAESILNPNAVIVTGPGYTGPDGLSIMPDYGESLTVSELIDLVAYLKSLEDEHGHTSPAMPKPHGGGHEQDAHGQPGKPKGH